MALFTHAWTPEKKHLILYSELELLKQRSTIQAISIKMNNSNHWKKWRQISPRNENLNLLVWIKFLNLFLAHMAYGHVAMWAGVIGKCPLSIRSLAFHIYLFFSETAEQISTKLAINVHCMVLYQICCFGVDWKFNMAARANNVFWLVEI